MFLCVSCIFPTFARESPSLPQEGGSHRLFCNWFWSLLSCRWRESIIFVNCWSFLKPHHAYSYKGERNRSRPTKCFILLVFFVGTRFQGKGLGFIDNIVEVLMAFIYNSLLDLVVFYTVYWDWTNLHSI